jgi:competence ComEA-like helix-hairpin-helix protein
MRWRACGSVAGEMRYTRPQLTLLLALAGAALVGLGVRQWRAGFPEHATRLERFDQEDPVGWSAAPAVVASSRARERPGRAPLRGDAGPREPRVSSRGETVPRDPPAPDPRPLDLNHADTEQIARLPGVGPALARRIVAAREQRGEFASTDDLRGVLGLGPKKIAALRELVVARGAGAGSRDIGRAPPGEPAPADGARSDGARVSASSAPRETARDASDQSERCEGAECGPLPGDTP